MSSLDEALLPALVERRERQLYRSRKTIQGPQSTRLNIDGKQYLNFCSNNYLGLANHPALTAALKQGADNFGVGAGASHLINGHSRAHHALEEELADFLERPRAILFSTGYMANLGVVSALCGRGDLVLQDRLNHASLLDAGKLSSARLQRYLHTDPDSAQKHLQKNSRLNSTARRLLITDGVFSMDGDIAPLPELSRIAKQHQAWLMADDAHGFGVLGKSGRGTVEHFQLENDDVPIYMATLGKALGSFGAFVAGSEALIETLIQQARSYIYTTAMPAAIAEATRASLKLIQSETWRREKLQSRIQEFRTGAAEIGLPLMNSSTPIQPLLIGDTHHAMKLSDALYASGIFVSAIRPPTVPDGSARLRITLTAEHSESQVAQLLSTLDEIT